ncbi:hypothetical protein DAEQUDRAFT_105468 [Daedalea quercina L-15889]|uniref:Uncharacterized protein n=1 Tax=Daedalea quercina L-15889 TaxID=1314783 RepID=A0A165KUE4_9APHY|nr:hypothetical protein DAEQUDRAFT_105468 [Daedalea quercina L-15889]
MAHSRRSCDSLYDPHSCACDAVGMADALCNENEPSSNPSAVMSYTTITNVAPEFHGVTPEQDSCPAWLPEYPPSIIAPPSVTHTLGNQHSRLSGYSDVKIVPATPSNATSIWHPSSPVVNPSPYSLADLVNPSSQSWNVDGVPTMGQGVAPSLFAQAPDGSAQNARRPPTEPLRALIHQGPSSPLTQASCVYPSPIHAPSPDFHTSIPHPVGPPPISYPAVQSATGSSLGRHPGLPIQQAEWSESLTSVAPPRVWLISEHGTIIYTQATHLPSDQNDLVSHRMGLQEDPSLRVVDPRVLPPPPYAGQERDVHGGSRAAPMV